MIDYTQELQDEAPTLEYSPEEMMPPPMADVGRYKTFQHLRFLATGEPVKQEDIEWKSSLESAWNTVNAEQVAIDKALANRAISQNNVTVATDAIQSVRDRMNVEWAASKPERDKLEEVANAAIEKLYALNQRTISINTVQKAAQQIPEVAKEVAAAAALQKEVEAGTSWGNLGQFVLRNLVPFGGTAENLAIDEVAKKYLNPEDISFFGGVSETEQALQNRFRSLAPEDRAQWITNLFRDLKASWKISDYQAASVLKNLLDNEDIEQRPVLDTLNKIVPGLEILGLGLAARASTRSVKAAIEMNTAERALAKAGGKDILVSQQVGRVLQGTAPLVKEVTGVAAIEAMGSLASATVKHVLPSGISTAAADVQKAIISQGERALDSIRSTIGLKGSEALQEMAELQARFSPAVNPSVARLDFASDGAVVMFKPEHSNTFLTREAAEDWAKANVSAKYDIVEDTTNPVFLVSADARKALETELALATAERASLAKELAKSLKEPLKPVVEGGVPEAPVKPVVEAPKALQTSKPKYSFGPIKFDLEFDSLLDKAIYQVGSKSSPSKSDEAILQWIESQTGFTLDAVKQRASALRDTIKRLSRDADNVSAERIRIPATVAPEAQGMGAIPGIIKGEAPGVQFRGKLFFSPKANTRVVGNVAYSNTVPEEATLFVERLGKSLGVDGKLVVANVDDILTSPYTLLRVWNGTTARHIKGDAMFFIADDGIPVILVKNATQKTKVQWLETFAHEYGHLWEHQWGFKYSATLQTIFNDFLKARKIESISEGSLKTILEFRSYHAARDALRAGSADAYLKANPKLLKWMDLYNEFFAENFAKWALTDEVPTTVLGQAFKAITDGIKSILSNLTSEAAWTTKYLDPDERIAKLLNDHIAFHANTKKVKPATAIRESFLMADAMGVAKQTRLAELDDSIAHLSQELQAMDDAAKSLSNGYLVRVKMPNDLKFTDADIASASSGVAEIVQDYALIASRESYAERVVGWNIQSKMRNDLINFARKPLESLNKRDFKKVNDALIRGDMEGKEFTALELEGMGLSSKAQKAYFTFRTTRNMTYMLLNEAVASSLNRRGFKHLVNTNVTPGTFGRAVEPPGGLVWFADESRAVMAKEDFADKFPGVRIYELDNITKQDGRPYRYIATKLEATEELPITRALNYRPGEFRRIYTDEHMVKLTMNGYDKPVLHRTAGTYRDGFQYVKSFKEAQALHKAGKLTIGEASRLMEGFDWKPEELVAAFARGDFDEVTDIQVLGNRLDSDSFDEDHIRMGNSAFAKRGEEAIKNVRGEVNTLSPLESLSSEIANTAFVHSITAWRDTQVLRWFNTFIKDSSEYEKYSSMEPNRAFAAYMKERGEHFVGTDKRRVFQRNVENYIESQLNITTPLERNINATFARAWKGLQEGEGVVAKVAGSKVIQGMSEWEVTSGLRQMAFHAYFAMNPKTFIMQAMNTANAAMLHPIHGTKAAAQMPALVAALAFDSEKAWRAAAVIGKLGIGTDEFVETVRAIKRSGLLQAAEQTQLWGRSDVGGIFDRTTRRTLRVSGAMFEYGDKFGRIMSFDIARRDFIATNPGVAWWTDENLATIVAKTDALTQNLSNANTASWQRGLASIPTQFMQYPIKFATNVASAIYAGKNRNLTRKQAVQLLAFHMLAFGTAGNAMFGLGGVVSESLAEEDEDTRYAVQQGAMGVVVDAMAQALTGEELKLAMGATYGTMNFYSDFFEGLMGVAKGVAGGKEEDAPTVFDMLAGASGGALVRTYGGLSKAMNLWLDAGMTPEAVKAGAWEIAKTFTVANNIDKAMIAQAMNGAVYSKSGNLLYFTTENEQMAKALGFETAKATDLSALYKTDQARQAEIKRVAGRVAFYRTKALEALANGDTEAYNTYEAAMRIHRNHPDLEIADAALKESFKGKFNSKQQELLMKLFLEGRKPEGVTVTTSPTKVQ